MKSKAKLISAFLVVLLLLSLFSVTAFADSGNTTLTATIPCTVTLQVGDHGKVTVDGTDYTGNAGFQRDVGTAVTYTFTPNGLYRVDKVIYNGTEVTSELSGNTWTAPALTGNAALSVSFKFLGGGGTDTYTVTFNANGHGTAPASQTVLSGNKAAEPTAPTASGWTFGGWYKDSACTETQKYDFNTPVKANLDLYAKWTENGNPPTPPVPVTHTVSFNMNGHGTQVPYQTVADGNKATEPVAPTASGYTFKGWYTDSTFQTAFDFGTAIHADTTLYAKWVANSVTPTDPTNPKTGDNSNLLLWVVLLAASGAALTGTAIYSRKRKKTN